MLWAVAGWEPAGLQGRALPAWGWGGEHRALDVGLSMPQLTQSWRLGTELCVGGESRGIVHGNVCTWVCPIQQNGTCMWHDKGPAAVHAYTKTPEELRHSAPLPQLPLVPVCGAQRVWIHLSLQSGTA